jgi:tRNA-specific 2-thiouridylase
MFREYERGRTPNPDVLCNREIKFDVFLKAALELGADYVATGHYCQKKEFEDGSFGLLAGKDKNKDQSYFLSQISQKQLEKALFPIGNLEKSEVRAIAKEIGLVNAEKKDSQGLCFVGKISLPTFLQQQLKPKIGDVIEIPASLQQYKNYDEIDPIAANVDSLSQPFYYSPNDGIKVAEHQGAHYYTIGQRRGLHIGGRPDPSFVIGIDTTRNIVYSGQCESHPGLNKWALQLEKDSMNWIRTNDFNLMNGLECLVRIRYRQPLQKAKLIQKSDEFYILFDQKQRGITPGQFASWYIDNELIGSSAIRH